MYDDDANQGSAAPWSSSASSLSETPDRASPDAIIRDHLNGAIVEGERNIDVDGGTKVFAPGEDRPASRKAVDNACPNSTIPS